MVLEESVGTVTETRASVPKGVVTAVSRDSAHRFTKPNVESIELIAGLGVKGDAHWGETVQHLVRVREDPTRPNLRQVHLIHGELHDELKQQGFTIGPGDIGENITTRGIDLLSLPCRARLRIGRDAVVEVTGLRTPCKQIERFQPGLLAAVSQDASGNLFFKSGIMGIVLKGGLVRPGDSIRAELPPEPHQKLGKVGITVNREQAVVGGVLTGLLCVGVAAQALAAAAPVFSPNPAVGWISLSTDFSPPATGAGPVQQDPRFPRVSNEEFRATGRQPTIAQGNPEAPILQPWAKDALRKRNALVQSGKGGLSRQASCWPVGVPGFVLHVIHPIFLIQGPKEVVMVWQGDHVVRRVHLDVPHSREVKPSWFGESVGHYEGDTLVIDTIGIDKRTYVDGYQTPHSEQLHVVERIRMVDGGKGMEINVNVEDPGAFTMPWSAVQRWRRVEPGVAENDIPLNPLSSSTDAGPLIESVCAENPFSYFGDKSIPVPRADAPDF